MLIISSVIFIAIVSTIIVFYALSRESIFGENRAIYNESGAITGFQRIKQGIYILCVIFASDLIVLYVVPYFTLDINSTDFLFEYYASFSIYTKLIGVVLVLIGLRLVSSFILPRVEVAIQDKNLLKVSEEDQLHILRLLLENMDLGLLVVSAEGEILVMNKKYIDILELREEEIEVIDNMKQLEIVEAKKLSSLSMTKTSNSALFDETALFKHATREDIVFEVRNTSVAEGGFLRTYRDITESIQLETYSSEVLSHVPEGVIAIDKIGIVTSINPAAEKMFGFSAKEVIGKNIKILMPQETAVNHDFYLRRYLASQNNNSSKIERQAVGEIREVISQRKDGSQFPMELSVSEIKIADRHSFVGVCRDISDRKRTEAMIEFRYNVERISNSGRSRVAKAKNPSAAVDQTLRKIGMLLGASCVTLIQFPDTEMDAPAVNTWHSSAWREEPIVQTILQNSPSGMQHLDPSVHGGTNLHVTCTAEHTFRDNSLRQRLLDVQIHSFIVCPVLEKSEIVAFLYIENMTIENKIGEIDLWLISRFASAIYTTLDRRRMENALKKAKNDAEQANDARARFVATMSHEIRTPMNGILGMVDLMLNSQNSNDTEQFEMLQTINASGQILRQLIDDVLDFSKIESGNIELERIPMSLLNILEDTVNSLMIMATEQDIRVVSYIDPTLPDSVLGDPNRIRQIMVNLIGNAIKFSEQKDIYVKAEREKSDEDGVVIVRFSVKDQGIGISKRAQKMLFKPFVQANSSTTRKFGGTGLGLTISKDLVDAMGGKIGVNSTRGKGSEFYFSVLLEVSIEAPEDRWNYQPIDDLKILVIDSCPMEQEALLGYLRHWQFSVGSRDSLSGVLEHCLGAAQIRQPYDVVIFGPQWPRDESIPISDSIRAKIPLTKFIFIQDETRRKERSGNQTKGVFINARPVRRIEFKRAVWAAGGGIISEARSQQIKVEKPVVINTHSTIETGKQEFVILVAEDNAINRDVIGRQLTQLGYAFSIVDDGQIALEAWRAGSFGLVLTDCHMPNLDGFELTHAIRKDEIGTDKRVPIIAITANNLEGDDQVCLEAGMDDFIAKPMTLNELAKVLDKWVPKYNQKEN